VFLLKYIELNPFSKRHKSLYYSTVSTILTSLSLVSIWSGVFNTSILVQLDGVRELNPNRAGQRAEATSKVKASKSILLSLQRKRRVAPGKRKEIGVTKGDTTYVRTTPVQCRTVYFSKPNRIALKTHFQETKMLLKILHQ